MKMTLHVGLLLSPIETRDVVKFDSAHPEQSEQYLGHWWKSQIHVDPNLLKPGAYATDGLRSYEVLSVESPIFEVRKFYCQRFHQLFIEEAATRNSQVVEILECWMGANHIWMYRLMYGRSPLVYKLTENELMQLLTEPTYTLPEH